MQETNSSTESNTEEKPNWLNWSDQFFAGTLAIIILAALLIQWGWFRTSKNGAEIERPVELQYQFSLDINSATRIEWMQLEGIGEVMADKIIRDLKQNGSFQSINELTRISGIGKKTLEKMRPHLRIDTKNKPEK